MTKADDERELAGYVAPVRKAWKTRRAKAVLPLPDGGAQKTGADD